MAHVFKRKLIGQNFTLSSMLKKATDFVNTKSVDEALINFIRMAKVLTGDSYIVLREKIHFTVIKKPGTLAYKFCSFAKNHLYLGWSIDWHVEC